MGEREIDAGGDRHIFQVVAEEAGVRLDVWLHGRMPAFSRSRLQSLIREGAVRSGGCVLRPGMHVQPGMDVEIVVPRPVNVDVRPQSIPLNVLYEDGEVIVINKPPGLVVHPAAGHPDGTLVNALLYHCADLAGIGGERRPGIVHRLDKDTSGALVAAKTQAAMEGLVAQFKGGGVLKEYLALVQGLPKPAEGRIETLIGRHPTDRKRMSARVQRGRRAVSNFKVEEALGDFSLLRVRIETGRTHQIRVHLAHIGHPVLGDRQYGRGGGAGEATEGGVSRQMLHAETLEFTHPIAGKRIRVFAPLAEDMARLLTSLRGAQIRA